MENTQACCYWSTGQYWHACPATVCAIHALLLGCANTAHSATGQQQHPVQDVYTARQQAVDTPQLASEHGSTATNSSGSLIRSGLPVFWLTKGWSAPILPAEQQGKCGTILVNNGMMSITWVVVQCLPWSPPAARPRAPVKKQSPKDT